MFGYVTANMNELTQDQQQRYHAVYCGICRQIRDCASQTARFALSYDMTFLALLLMSLYEPEEITGKRACMLHPFQNRPWVDNEYIRYAAEMNIALGYYNARDDVEDDNHLTAKIMSGILKKTLPEIRRHFPRQCDATEQCIIRLNQLEKANCANPDEPASCFGTLMAELLVYREDQWAPILRQMGMALGRFIYLTDAAMDYRKDAKKQKYNPFLAMGSGENFSGWEQYLLSEMACCTQQYEKLPLVQDKPLLDAIVYSGVWMNFERKRPKAKGVQEEDT